MEKRQIILPVIGVVRAAVGLVMVDKLGGENTVVLVLVGRWRWRRPIFVRHLSEVEVLPHIYCVEAAILSITFIVWVVLCRWRERMLERRSVVSERASVDRAAAVEVWTIEAAMSDNRAILFGFVGCEMWDVAQSQRRVGAEEQAKPSSWCSYKLSEAFRQISPKIMDLCVNLVRSWTKPSVGGAICGVSGSYNEFRKEWLLHIIYC